MLPISYARHQFSSVIIQHGVWLSLRFTLSYRDVEDLLAERGLDVSYETIRGWVLRLGPVFARRLRSSRPKPTARWHLDEMVMRIAGETGLSLACCRSRRRGARRGGAAAAGQGGGSEADAQAAQEARLRARRRGHRQAAIVR